MGIFQSLLVLSLNWIMSLPRRSTLSKKSLISSLNAASNDVSASVGISLSMNPSSPTSDAAEFMCFAKGHQKRNIIIPPLNFAMVSSGVYRSGFPNNKNFEFLRHLGLRTIVYLGEMEYPESNEDFIKRNSICLYRFNVVGNKEPFLNIPYGAMREALLRVLSGPHPVLVHCSKGTHRTGALIGCLRKIQEWSLTAILDEYRRFAGRRVRVLDEQFIELFEVQSILDQSDSNREDSSSMIGCKLSIRDTP